MDKRKWPACLTALAVLLALAAAAGAAAENPSPFGVLSGISWSLSEDGELALRGRGDLPGAALNREEEASGGLDAWYEMPWHAFRESIRRVTLSEGITAVGDHAFDGCLNLESAVLPEGLERIGEAAFRGTGLRSLVLPDSVTRIGAHAFSGCWRLEDADLGESLTDIGPYAFYQDGALVSVVLPGSLRSAGRDAFSGCGQVETVVFRHAGDVSGWAGIRFENAEANPMAAGGRATLYDGETPLAVLRLSAGSPPVGDYAFYRCRNELTVQASQDYEGPIGNYAFYQCENLLEAGFGAHVSGVGAYAFSGCGRLTDTGSLLAGVSRLMDGAFSGCVSLASAHLGGGLREIGTGVFSGCAGLSSVTLDGGLPLIPDRMFSDCGSLEQIRIPSGTVRIGEDAFRLCVSLRSAVIPETVTSVGAGAFGGCSSLKDIAFLGHAPAIAPGAFGVVRADAAFFDGPSWQDSQKNYGGFLNWVPVSGGKADGSQVWRIDEDRRLIFSGKGPVVSNLGWSAFKGIFREIVLEEGITGIRSDLVFSSLPEDGKVSFHAGIRDTLGDDQEGISVRRLAGKYDFTVREDWAGDAFWSLTRDGTLTVGGSGPIPDFGKDGAPWKQVMNRASSLTVAPGVTAIGAGAFRGGGFGGAVVLPDTVREIGADAFAACSSLRWMVIPSSVGAIGEGALPDTMETVYAPAGSFAARWAEGKGLSVYDSDMPDSLVVLRENADLSVEETLDLESLIRVEPFFRRADHQVTYRADGNARLDGSVLIPLGTGTVTVKAFLDGRESAGLTVSVRRPVVSLSMPKEAFAVAGELFPLPAVSWEPQDAEPVLTWSVSDPETARLEGDSLVTLPRAEGTVILTATAWNGVSAQMRLQVYVPKVRKVAFRQTESSVYPVGGSLALVCEVTNQLATLINQQVVFSSSRPDLIAVDEEGQVSFLHSGSAVITAEAAGGVSDSVTLTAAVPAESFALEGPDVIALGQTPAQLSLTRVVPGNAGLSIEWTVSDSRVAGMKGNTLVPYRSGEVTVTARNWDGVSAEKTVRVYGRVTDIAIAPVPETQGTGARTALEVTPMSGNEPADPALVTFVSSNENVARVTQEGLVSFLSDGDAVITASAGTAEASVPFRVRTEVTDFRLPDSLTIMQYHAVELPVTGVLPENAWQEFTSAAGEPEVLLIDPEGILIGRRPGETYLTVTSWNGVTRSVRVAVLPFEAENELILPSVTRTVRSHSFTGASFEAVTVPAGCREIGEYAFADCRDLICLFLPDSLQRIDETAFSGCDALVCVIAPKGSYAEKWALRRGLLVFNE